MGGLVREKEKKLYKISWILVGLLVAALFFMTIDYALAGVVVKGEESTLTAFIISWPECEFFSRCSAKKWSQKQLIGFGTINADVSHAFIEFDGRSATASAKGTLSIASLGNKVEFTKNMEDFTNNGEGIYSIRPGLEAHTSAIAQASMVMDIVKPKQITLEIGVNVLFKRTKGFAADGSSTLQISKKDSSGRFTRVFLDTFLCSFFSFELQCARNAVYKVNLEVAPGQELFIQSGTYVDTAAFVAVSFSGNVNYTIRVIEEGGCSGLTLDVTPTEVWPIETGASNVNTANISAKISNPAPPGGCVVDLDVEPQQSQGHSHGIHPKNKAGRVAVSGNTTPSCTIPEGSTKCDSMVTYKAPEISGEEKITATLADRGEKAEKTIRIRVPGLNPLSSGTGYRLTGSFGDAGVTSEHTENHYGTEPAKARIIMLSLDYLNSKKATLGINDMSLPWGGLFDVGNNWSSNPGHGLHREGKSVDIDRNALGTDGKSKKVDQERLDKIAEEKWGLDRIPEPPRVNCPDCIHYESPD